MSYAQALERLIIVYNAPITKSHLSSQCNPHQNTTDILYIKNNDQFIRNHKRFKIINPENEERGERLKPLQCQLQNILQRYNNIGMIKTELWSNGTEWRTKKIVHAFKPSYF